MSMMVQHMGLYWTKYKSTSVIYPILWLILESHLDLDPSEISMDIIGYPTLIKVNINSTSDLENLP